MIVSWLHKVRMAVVSALGVAVLMGSPLLAYADHGNGNGKWWKPNDKGRRVEMRGRGWDNRDSRGYYRSWRGPRVHRDIIVIRDARRGAYFRARRIFITPRYDRRVIYVRPVRYFIAADACIGGVNIHARIVRPHYVYGCNFCDERFDSYGAYAAHVSHCDHAPSGYRIASDDWTGYDDADWNGPYETDEDWDY